MAEKKRFVMQIAETRHFEFEVWATSQTEAESVGLRIWREAPTTGQWELPGTETDYHAAEMAQKQTKMARRRFQRRAK